MINNIRVEFKEMVKENDWMDAMSKQAAQEKVSHLRRQLYRGAPRPKGKGGSTFQGVEGRKRGKWTFLVQKYPF